MLQAAAMLVGLAVIWLLLTPMTLSLQALAVAGVVAGVCVGAAVWFCGFERLGVAPLLLLGRLRRTGDNARATLSVARAAIAADVSLRPALILIKPRAAPAAVRAGLVHAINSAPGQLAVEADGDGLLIHALDEEAVQPEQIAELESSVRAAMGQGVGQ